MHSTASGFVAANDTSPLFAFLGVACANGGMRRAVCRDSSWPIFVGGLSFFFGTRGILHDFGTS
jgi:hypothetical protein